MKLKNILSFFAVLFVLETNAQVVISEFMYNNPGDDELEFIELHNTSSSEIDLNGYSLSEAVSIFFDDIVIPGDGYLVVAKNATVFENVFGLSTLQWENGSLNNTSDLIQLLDDFGDVMDEISYSSGGDWPILANGYGGSLERCEPNGVGIDNWRVSSTNVDAMYDDQSLFCSPGVSSNCTDNAVIALKNTEGTVLEDGVKMSVVLIVNNPGIASTISLSLDMGSVANDDDFTISTTVQIPAGINGEMTFDIMITDDELDESNEILMINLSDPTEQIFFYNSSYSLTIIDNDDVIDANLILTGIYDAQSLVGSSAQGIELYAKENIADLSKYGVGFAHNGGGSQGQEFQFPSVSLTAGQFVYVTLDGSKFKSFFGFDADFISPEVIMDGNDAIELYESGVLIDVFGDVNTDGTGTAWEYSDGWAYRNSGFGPEKTFQINNWKFSGKTELSGNTNADATKPFPIETFSEEAEIIYVANDDHAIAEFNFFVTIDVLGNDENTNLITNGLTISVDPSHGTVLVNDDLSVTYTPTTGYCGDDNFTYKACAGSDCKEAMVQINVRCPIAYPTYSIAIVTQNNSNGTSIYKDTTCTLKGVVYGVNLNSDGLSFTIIDHSGAGINVFSSNENFGYSVKEGDEVSVKGKVGEFKGLTEFFPTEIEITRTNMDLIDPVLVTELNESAESNLVRIDNVHFVDANQWTKSGSGFNVEVTDGTHTYTLRIDDDVDLYAMDIPSGESFSIVGIGGQSDATIPYSEGYQLFPRFASDIMAIVGVKEPTFVGDLKIYPNPMNNVLFVNGKTDLDAIRIIDLYGREIIRLDHPQRTEEIDVSFFNAGIYFIKFEKNEMIWTEKMIKK